MMELAQDPELLKAVREEVETAYVTDHTTGRRALDLQKTIGLPLLQSIYTETLRLHMSINVARMVLEPIEIEGYELGAGTLLQAPTTIAHTEEDIWSVDGHPASQFWARRHLKEVDGTQQFATAGRPSSFFPFGLSSLSND